MITLSCPACGASVNFHSKASVFAVCSFCKSTLVRHDMDLEKLGLMSELQDEMTPFQVGTAGVFGKKPFEIVGRLRIKYADGFWNEWYCFFSDGREGWLAEAQGFYAMCFPVSEKESGINSGIPRPQVGKIMVIKPHGEFVVDDIHDVTCIYSEGELPMNAASGRRSTSVDLRGVNLKMATIEFAEDCTRIFVGEYKEFDEFKFTRLREIDGW
ncbi:MAG: DUF4178 domain-containing protein [Candidatus Obscuribacterales bacterium]|nr:DUF4178 domain-containing protein [Candidatus Obscuribacterales bacterium]